MKSNILNNTKSLAKEKILLSRDTKFCVKNRPLLGITFLVAVGTLAGILLPWQENFAVQGLRIIAGSIFILFLPGFFLTKAFFEETEIDMLERVALSFALSISVVPLLTFYANLVGVPVSAVSVYAIVVVTIILTTIYLRFFQKTQTLPSGTSDKI